MFTIAPQFQHAVCHILASPDNSLSAFSRLGTIKGELRSASLRRCRGFYSARVESAIIAGESDSIPVHFFPFTLTAHRASAYFSDTLPWVTIASLQIPPRTASTTSARGRAKSRRIPSPNRHTATFSEHSKNVFRNVRCQMKAAIKAINEDNATALATALDSLEDVNGVFFLFVVFLLRSFEIASLSCRREGLHCTVQRSG
jgi:hypothetical protein